MPELFSGLYKHRELITLLTRQLPELTMQYDLIIIGSGSGSAAPPLAIMRAVPDSMF